MNDCKLQDMHDTCASVYYMMGGLRSISYSLYRGKLLKVIADVEEVEEMDSR